MYYPPEWEPSKGSLNKFHGSHGALGDRARKLKSEGILIIRFEMPFNVWCAGCNHLIGKVGAAGCGGVCLLLACVRLGLGLACYPLLAGQRLPLSLPGPSTPAPCHPPPPWRPQGVRFNAEKKQIGMYHSTRIWSFRMRTPCCQGTIEVHTDPKNAEYVIVSGARRCAGLLRVCWAGWLIVSRATPCCTGLLAVWGMGASSGRAGCRRCLATAAAACNMAARSYGASPGSPPCPSPACLTPLHPSTSRAPVQEGGVV